MTVVVEAIVVVSEGEMNKQCERWLVVVVVVVVVKNVAIFIAKLFCSFAAKLVLPCLDLPFNVYEALVHIQVPSPH